jgi:hypothetical protein
VKGAGCCRTPAQQQGVVPACSSQGHLECSCVPSQQQQLELELERAAGQPAARRGGLPASRLRRLARGWSAAAAAAGSGRVKSGRGRWWWGGVRPTCDVSCRSGCGARVWLCVCVAREGVVWCCFLHNCMHAVVLLVHVLLVLCVCGLCAVLLMARQGTHLYVLNRDPGGRRQLCAGAHCMCVAGCSACSSILVCAWVVLVLCCSACFMQVVLVEVVSLRLAGCVVFTSVCMCLVGCLPVCCCCACMFVWPVCGVADGSPGDAPVCAQPGLQDA